MRPRQRVRWAFVKPADFRRAEARIADLHDGAKQHLGRQYLHRVADGLSPRREPMIRHRPTARTSAFAGEDFRRRTEIKLIHTEYMGCV